VWNETTRKGAIAPYIEPHHIDVQSFLDLKKNSGEERHRAHDVFPALWINDLFMQRVREDALWTLFDPYETADLHTLYGDEFEEAYVAYENDNTIRKEVVKAKNLWKDILRSYFESGSPFLTFKDTANKRNPNKHNGVIHSTNLCFTGDTVVAVADGRNGVTIKQLSEESGGKIKFPVYSGVKRNKKYRKRFNLSSNKEEIEYAVAFKTGTKKVITVRLSNGDEFRCTPEHILFTIDGDEIKAKDSKGVMLESTFTFTSNKGTPYRHIGSISNGYSKQHLKIAEFYGVIKDIIGVNIDHIKHENEFNNCVGFDNISNLRQLDKRKHIEITNKSRFGLKNPIHRLKDSIRYAFNTSISMTGEKNSRYSGITNVELIEMFSSWCKENGIRNPVKVDYVTFAKISREMGLKVPLSFSMFRFKRNFNTFFNIITGKEQYVEVKDERKMIRDTCDDSRIDYIQKHFRPRVDGKIVSKGLVVTDIIDNGEIEEVYDLTVDNNHNFYILTSTEDDGYLNAQGVLVHNCTEIFQNTSAGDEIVDVKMEDGEIVRYPTGVNVEVKKGVIKEVSKLTSLDMVDGKRVISAETKNVNDEIAVCNLMSINLGRVNTREDLERVIPVAVRMLDNVVSLNFYPTETVMRTALSKRAIGLGVMGQAEMLARKGILFGTQEHYELIDAVGETYSYVTIKASVDLAKERGSYPDFEGSSWSKGIMPIDNANELAKQLTTRPHHYDWDTLREEAKSGIRNGYLMAIAPTSSISILTGTTQSIEPVYKRKWFEENLSGLIPVTAPGLDASTWSAYKPVYEYDQVELIKGVSVLQKWLDQGISCNVFITLDKAGGAYLNKIYMTAWEYGLKSTYYLRSESPEAKDEESVADRSQECIGCQ